MHYTLYFLLFFLAVAAQITDPSQWPDFSDLRQCAKLGLTGYDCGPTGCETVAGTLGCGDWTCVCEHFSEAMVALSSIVEGYCSSSQDVASATSILNGFCEQLTVTATGPSEPTTTGVGATALVSSTVTVPVTVSTEITITPSLVVATGLVTITSTNFQGQVVTYTSSVASTIPVVQVPAGSSSSGNAVAIGIGVGIGIPAFIIGCVAVFLMFRILKRPRFQPGVFGGNSVILVNGNQVEK